MKFHLKSPVALCHGHSDTEYSQYDSRTTKIIMCVCRAPSVIPNLECNPWLLAYSNTNLRIMYVYLGFTVLYIPV
jgi:hypothetical protein